MNSTERRMKLILMLQQSNKRLTIKDLSEKFNVTERTIYRDFNALSELNVPVTHNKYKGYGIMQGYSIPPIMFSKKELATIMIGLNFVKSQIDKTLVEDAEGVELKIKEVIPQELIRFMESLNNRTIVDPYLHYGPDKVEGGNWYKISNAIAENHPISFQYKNQSNGKITKRNINPYILVFYRDHWNVIGLSKKRKAVRNFLLDRMAKIELKDSNFVPNGKINPESLIFKSVDTSSEIQVQVQKSTVRRFKANLPAKIIRQNEIKPNLYSILFKFDNLDFINEWLLQFSTFVKIIAPDELIHKHRVLLKKMISKMD